MQVYAAQLVGCELDLEAEQRHRARVEADLAAQVVAVREEAGQAQRALEEQVVAPSLSIYLYTHVCMYTYIYMIYTYMSIYIHIYIHTYIHTHTDTHTQP